MVETWLERTLSHSIRKSDRLLSFNTGTIMTKLKTIFSVKWNTHYLFPFLLFSSPNEDCVHQEWGEEFDKVMINDQPSADFIRDINLCNIADRFYYCQKSGPWQKNVTSYKINLFPRYLWFISLGSTKEIHLFPQHLQSSDFLRMINVWQEPHTILWLRKPGLLKLKSCLYHPSITNSYKEPERRIQQTM